MIKNYQFYKSLVGNTYTTMGALVIIDGFVFVEQDGSSEKLWDALEFDMYEIGYLNENVIYQNLKWNMNVIAKITIEVLKMTKNAEVVFAITAEFLDALGKVAKYETTHGLDLVNHIFTTRGDNE